MQLSPQESSTAFWNGAVQGAKRSLGYVALVGLPLIGLMAFGVIPAAVMGYGAVLLTGISTVFTVGMYSGQNALAQYHQSKHNQMYEAQLARLEGRTATLDREVDEVQHSPRVTTILEEGAKSASGSYADAEEERRADAPKSRTIH